MVVHGARWLPIAAFGLIVAGASGGQAAEAKLPFRVEYAENAGCGSAEAFSAKLLRHTDRVRPAGPADSAIVFHVELSDDEGTLRGRLGVVEPDGSEMLRDVPGASCDEVFAAMALIAAVLVDPNASVSPLASAEAPLPERKPLLPPPAEPRPVSKRPSPWGFGAGVGVAVEGAVAPDPMAGISVGADAAFERGQILSPRFALALNHTFTHRVETPSGVARLTWTAVRASGCPARWPATGPWSARPCATFDIGALSAAGERTERRDSATMIWAAPGASAYFDLQPMKPLKVTFEGGLVVPLVRDHFYFDPKSDETTAFEVPPIGAVARLGVSTRFP